MSSGPSIDEIKAAANARVYDVLAALGIRERVRGGYIHMCNPVAKDRHPSFTIWPERGGFLTFRDHSGDAQGDIIDLVAYLRGWWDGQTRPLPRHAFRMSLRFLADLTGLAHMSPQQRATDAARSRTRARVEQKKADEELARKQARAFDMWLQAEPIADTVADHYLRRRGIDLRELPPGPRGGDRIPSVLRTLRGSAQAENYPAMIAGCVDVGSAGILAVHRTFLARDGLGKAPIVPNRKVWPDFRGLVIPLWRGESRLGVRAAAAAGLRESLQLAEGIETALAMAIAAPQYRTWAFISLSNLQNVALPECCDGVLLSRENDDGNGAAEGAFARGKAALERQGRPVAEVRAPLGKDLADTLQGAAL